ncbi:uncharacterized protein CMU_031950 [Cryptosporidium muris RN66]|uniref:WD domain, G-beta repeat-containing protein n=1 Tax=Cryptosporidium muris (strain RN66) TaxID=441375 RepID=B6AIL3_CRYMR|nr:uncharacterized protein CMU_031950 [Cryptosporidium muris RN66]EEA08054.1 hypothetical protein, conserved [Cryptosporidium muris RN66]|eukprot:XP_002142403.1 hypothetical protein [Cryptosporidium muris RN66]
MFFNTYEELCEAPLASVTTIHDYVFASFIGDDSKIKVYKIDISEADKTILKHICYLESKHGGLTRLVSSPNKMNILGVTCYGWIYGWNINDIKEINYSNNSINILPKPRLCCTIGHPGESICIDFLNNNIFIVAGINPGSSIIFVSVETGKVLARNISQTDETSSLAWPVYYSVEEKDRKHLKQELAIYSFTTIAVELSLSGGCWIALGDSNGFIVIFYIASSVISRIEERIYSEDFKNEILLSNNDILWVSHQICELCTEIRSLCWRPRTQSQQSLCLVCGTTDSLIRYCFIESDRKILSIKRVNLVKTTDGTFSNGEIRSLAFSQLENDKSQTLIAACNMFSSSKKHPLFISSDKISRRNQSFCSFKVYTQDYQGNNSSGIIPIYSIGTHQDLITCICASSCGKYILSVSIDKVIRLYSR